MCIRIKVLVPWEGRRGKEALWKNSPPFLMCEGGYFNYFRRKNLPHTYNKTLKAAPDCKGNLSASYFAALILPGKARAVRNHPPSSHSQGAASHTETFQYFEFLRWPKAVPPCRESWRRGPGLRPLWPVPVHKVTLAVQSRCSSTRRASSSISENNNFVVVVV